MDKLNMNAASLQARFLSRQRDDEGATAVECSLPAALIAGIRIVAVTAFGKQVASVFTTLTGKLVIS
jgi:pilus assembly protein Flp/PilA